MCSAVLGACLQQRCVGEHERVHAVGSCQIPQVIQGLAHLADLQHGHSLSLKVKPEIRPQQPVQEETVKVLHTV